MSKVKKEPEQPATPTPPRVSRVESCGCVILFHPDEVKVSADVRACTFNHKWVAMD